MDQNLKCSFCGRAGGTVYENTVIELTGLCIKHQGRKTTEEPVSPELTDAIKNRLEKSKWQDQET